jgi:MurNAc alpha-1-phosphate uridylyltransferase
MPRARLGTDAAAHMGSETPDSSDGLAAVVLAAGAGTRLRPLTDLVPKALCPVLNIALLDWALRRATALTPAVAVNAHHRADQLAVHLGGAAHLSIEHPEALGTAGALGRLRAWIDGRAVLAVNADAWGPDDLRPLVDAWAGDTVRLLVAEDGRHPDFTAPDGRAQRFAGASLLPGADAARLSEEPVGLYEAVWMPAQQGGRLELVETAQPFFDCGTPSEYLAANLFASGGERVIGEEAVIEGEVVRSVVWPGGVVAPGERLVECIRAGADVTVPAPQGSVGIPPAGRGV